MSRLLITKVLNRIGLKLFWHDIETNEYYVQTQNRTYNQLFKCRDKEQFDKFYASALKYKK